MADLETRQMIRLPSWSWWCSDVYRLINDAVVHTDGSVTLGQRSERGLSARVGGRIRCEQSGEYQTISSSMRTNIETVFAALRWLFGTSVTRALIITSSQSMHRKVQNVWLWHEWLPSIISHLRNVVRIYHPGHAGVRGKRGLIVWLQLDC